MISPMPRKSAANPTQMMIQVEGVVYTLLYCALATFVVLMIVKALVGLRVSPEIEKQGLDHALHGEKLHH